MNATFALRILAGMCVSFASTAANAQAVPRLVSDANGNTSVRLEAQHAIEKGLSWLEKHQDTNGCWSPTDHPAVTALALTAFKLHAMSLKQKVEPEAVKK